MIPSNFLSGNRCAYCSKKIKKTDKMFQQEVFDNVKNEYTFLEEYQTSKEKIKIQHNLCKHIYEVSPDNFLSKESRCPKCSSVGPSRIEKEVFEYIKSLLSDINILQNDRTILEGKEIDIFIPSKNIGFEFDGLYWHSSKYKDKNFHLEKTLKAKQKGIQLIHIFEDEWCNKQDLVKRKIKHILGENNERIYARNCVIKQITHIPDKTKFLNENHIQGSDACKFAYGLYYKDKLVALMSFKQDNNVYELSRYATSCNIIGGFGKLLKHSIINQNIKEIYTFADLRFTNPDNNIYLKNNFKYISTSNPNYWYVINNERKNRRSFQKAKLKEKFSEIYSDDKTEEQIMLEAGYYRIYMIVEI